MIDVVQQHVVDRHRDALHSCLPVDVWRWYEDGGWTSYTVWGMVARLLRHCLQSTYAAFLVLGALLGQAGAQQQLPPVTVTPPPPAKTKAKAAATSKKSPTAAPQTKSGAIAAPASGAPNTASGPSVAPSLASQLTVPGEELNARPATRPGEILEAAPGLIVTQHSGEGNSLAISSSWSSIGMAVITHA